MSNGDKEGVTGLKAVPYLIVFLVLTAIAILIQVKQGGFQGPLSDNILIIILVLANFLLLATVIFMLARSLWKLYVERKRGVLGAKFRTKLVVAFVSLSFIPTVLLFIIASGMFTRSIERLFYLKIENSLKDAVSMTQAYYNRLQAQANTFGKHISGEMTEERLLEGPEIPVLKDYLNKRSNEYGLGAVELFTSPRERSIVVVTDQFPSRTFIATPLDLVERAFAAEESASVGEAERKGEIVRAVVPVYGSGDHGQVIAAVSVSYYIPQNMTAKTEAIREGYTQYRSSFSGKESIKLSYRLGFLAVTLALVLAAIWVALRVAAGITVPIRKLAEGTEAVAAGDLDYRVEDKSSDEVGMLVQSFNRMTADIKSSREEVERKRQYTETVLSNINTGVISIDHAGTITTINPAASKILGVKPQDIISKKYVDAFGFIELEPIRDLFRKLDQGTGTAEDIIQITVRGETLTLRMRISMLKESSGAHLGTVITFDDLTKLLRAQKAETWQGVARSIAHEFKNPLTPIKLSAERLRKKYVEKSPDFDKVFEECSRTIVQEADGLKRLVDEFANFARMPISKPTPQPLTPVLESAVQLYSSAHKDIDFVKEMAPDMPQVVIDAEQMKRVFINLFENAVEAMERKGRIWVSLRLNESGLAQVEVADEGAGIAAEDAPRLFEPGFSRKKRDSGLGLTIVDRVITEHNGSIRAEPNEPKGARFIIELPVKNG